MKADKIIKNAKIFTADKGNPQASALAVKDGKFVYVGNEAGLSDYEGEVSDLNGKCWEKEHFSFRRQSGRPFINVCSKIYSLMRENTGLITLLKANGFLTERPFCTLRLTV